MNEQEMNMLIESAHDKLKDVVKRIKKYELMLDFGSISVMVKLSLN